MFTDVPFYRLIIHLSPAALIWHTVFQAPTISPIIRFLLHGESPRFFANNQDSALEPLANSLLKITNTKRRVDPNRGPIGHHVKRPPVARRNTAPRVKARE